WGYINVSGEEVIPPEYELAGPFIDSLAMVSRTDNSGLPDLNAAQVYSLIMRGASGLKWGYIDKKGKAVTPMKYDWLDHKRNNYSLAMLNGKCGLIDRGGTEVVPPVYDNIEVINSDISFVMVGKKLGLISNSGKKLTEIKYDNISYPLNSLVTVVENGKSSFFSQKGKEMVLGKYDEIYPLSSQFYRIKQDGKYGVIDSEGKTLAQAKYNSIKLRDDIIEATIFGSPSIYIDRRGNEMSRKMQVYIHGIEDLMNDPPPQE
ncbi:MAG: WG repeat-containing protein, partial [Elusimicrobiota bacterium]|nr:WG repeat-containing protein [Elusimicrobiota bacterium]